MPQKEKQQKTRFKDEDASRHAKPSPPHNPWEAEPDASAWGEPEEPSGEGTGWGNITGGGGDWGDSAASGRSPNTAAAAAGRQPHDWKASAQYGMGGGNTPRSGISEAKVYEAATRGPMKIPLSTQEQSAFLKSLLSHPGLEKQASHVQQQLNKLQTSQMIAAALKHQQGSHQQPSHQHPPQQHHSHQQHPHQQHPSHKQRSSHQHLSQQRPSQDHESHQQQSQQHLLQQPISHQHQSQQHPSQQHVSYQHPSHQQQMHRNQQYGMHNQRNHDWDDILEEDEEEELGYTDEEEDEDEDGYPYDDDWTEPSSLVEPPHRHNSQQSPHFSSSSRTISHALGSGRPFSSPKTEMRPHHFIESQGAALLRAHKALFAHERLAKDRLYWSFSPDKDERVRSSLRWIQGMSLGVGGLGLQKFLQTGERGALFVNADYRPHESPEEPAFDWLTIDQLKSTLDKILQESVALYDPATQVIVFVFLLSKTGNSMAIWRRKIPLAEGFRERYQEVIDKTKDKLKDDYPVYVDELPRNTKQRRVLSKRKWWKPWTLAKAEP